MLTAYLDESGHETKDVVVIAGFLGNDQQWLQCAKEWKQGLGPQRTTFHMHDLRWTKFGTKKLLAILGPIPHQCGLRAVLGVVHVNDYYDMVSGTRAEKLTKGYYLALNTLIGAIIKNTRKTERIKLVLEEQHEYAFSAKIVFSAEDSVTPEGERRMAGIEYVRKDSTILTQPADYVAFAVLQGLRDRTSKKYRWCLPILKNTQTAFGLYPDRERLRKVLKDTLEKFPALMQEERRGCRPGVKHAQA